MRVLQSTAFLAMVALGANSARGQTPESAVFRVVSAVPVAATLDGEPYPMTGNPTELPFGRHTLSVEGPFLSELNISFELGPNLVRIVTATLSKRCDTGGFLQDEEFEVANWRATAQRDPKYQTAGVILIHGPEINASADPPCRSNFCCGFARYGSLNLTVRSTPPRMAIYEGRNFITQTDTTIALSYGITQSGDTASVVIRVVGPEHAGCKFDSITLIRSMQSAVTCRMNPVPRRE